MEKSNHILSLIKHKENAHLLSDFLSGEYVVVDLHQFDPDNNPVDLIIVDGLGFKDQEGLIKQLKNNVSEHVFLPVLLITPRQKVGQLSSDIWEVIDDLISIPSTKKEFLARVKSLLRTREQSLKLKRLDEKLLKESRERIKLAVQAGNIGFWDWDLNTNKVYYSKEWKEQIGFGEEEITNEYSEWESRIHPDDLQETLTKIKEYRENPKGYLENSFRFRHRDGSYLWILSKASLFYDDAGNPARLVGTHLDITNLKKAEQEAIEARKEAEQKEQLKTVFLQNISHEIRTPLNGIVGFIEFLKDPDLDDEEYENAVRIIEKSGLRMKNIINDLIDISKIETGQLFVEKVNTNINKVIEELYDYFEPEAHGKGLNISYYLDLEKEKSNINTDESRISQVLYHLLTNAVKFTDKGSIYFGYTYENEWLKFYVKDTGRGIDPNMVEAIYKPFIQGETKISRGHEGAGIGLTIAKASVEALGGSLWIDSAPGKGTNVFFTLPG